MTLTIKIKMENSAFEEDSREPERIIRELANRGHFHDLTPGDGNWIHDINGNTVGEWKVTGR
jgi:hypothetical protein